MPKCIHPQLIILGLSMLLDLTGQLPCLLLACIMRTCLRKRVGGEVRDINQFVPPSVCDTVI